MLKFDRLGSFYHTCLRMNIFLKVARATFSSSGTVTNANDVTMNRGTSCSSPNFKCTVPGNLFKRKDKTSGTNWYFRTVGLSAITIIITVSNLDRLKGNWERSDSFRLRLQKSLNVKGAHLSNKLPLNFKMINRNRTWKRSGIDSVRREIVKFKLLLLDRAQLFDGCITPPNE